jgi:uncharacterized protein (TIGR01777 family)
MMRCAQSYTPHLNALNASFLQNIFPQTVFYAHNFYYHDWQGGQFMKVLISGSHGLVGTALCSVLQNKGVEIIRLGRDFSENIDFRGIDAVVHLAGENIADGRWTATKRKRIEESRVAGTANLAKQILKSDSKPDVFISASAIGYYGNRLDEEISEKSTKGAGFLAEVCDKWECAAQSVEAANVRTVILRTGIVLSKEGGALRKMLLPFKAGAGGVLGNGKQFMSWISLTDMVEIIQFLINREDLHGPFNLVSPNPVTNYQLTKSLGKILRRPTIMPFPATVARFIFGKMADALLLSSTKVLPIKLIEAGYHFKHEDLNSALKEILA